MNYISLISFLTITIITLITVILRFISDIAFLGYNELISFLSGIGIVFSLVVVEQNSSHITVNFIKIPYIKLIKIVSNVFFIMFYAAFFCGQINAIIACYTKQYKTTILEIPLFINYSISALCGAVLILYSLKKLHLYFARNNTFR